MSTKQELQNKIDTKAMLEEQRKINDQLYAIKLVERLVFGFVGLALTAISLALIYAVVIKK